MAGDLRRQGVRETGRRGLPADSVLRCALLKQQRQLSYEELGNLCKSLLANDRSMTHRSTRSCAWVGRIKQAALATAGFERYGKTTRRPVFLAAMERVVPWAALCGLIEPVYPKPGNGRPPVRVERMLRIYFLQQWFDLSDPAVEEALYDSLAMRRFVGIDLGRGDGA